MAGGTYSSGSGSSETLRWLPRLLAPLALVACLIAVLTVVNGGSEETGQRGDRGDQQARNTSGGDEQGADGEQAPETYVVKPGDTLGAISESTGVPLARLEQLNPDIDPQVLQSGATLKLR